MTGGSMYSKNFAMAVVVDGKIVSEENQTIKVPFNEEFAVRLKNKLNTPVACDLYVNGTLVNQVGQLLIPGNSHLDIDRWVFKDKTDRKLVFIKNDPLFEVKSKTGETIFKVEEPNEPENGHIEARFYELNDSIQTIETHIHHHDYWPYYIYIDRYWTYPEPYYPRPYYPRPEIIWCGSGTLTEGMGQTQILNNNNDSYYSTSMGKVGSIKMDSSSGVINNCITNPGSFNNSVGKVGDGIRCPSEPLCVSNGAVAEGEKVDIKKEFEKFKNSDGILKKDPITMRLILQGYEKKIISCKKCQYIKKQETEMYCPRCGTKFVKN